ncbi:SDR family oxidoreductase [Herbiconiux sp. L3-i23]|uniref:SDR family oxidoreductase n=1 Tax=Herbiconiux sp. L3-i23 TaxID=2905871 RepID=UPI0020573EC2|nr:SDR family oxidoreductase [Herbiconiux sp. L3-i23]BDI23617.1 short-chain dehydrogenase [Herbiconiux sp. L3-i23]
MSAARVAVVTGGSAGLGRAIVREFADRGWDVAVLARGEDGLAATVAEVKAKGRRTIGIPTDVADPAAVEAAAAEIEAELGPIDAWVNNAMTSVFAEFLDVEPADFERAVQVDFFGYVNGTRAALKRMKPRDAGTIVQIGSALAHRGIPLQSAYCASKHAITGFSESVVTELLHAKSKVTVSQVDMPAMNTPQFGWVKTDLGDHPQPVPPIYQPELCAAVVVDVAEKPRRRTWVGESSVFTILGNRFGSRIADWRLGNTGVDGQQAPDVDAPMDPPNLHSPVAGDHGAHGVFDDRARTWSPQIWAIRNRPIAYAGAAVTAVAGIAATVAHFAYHSKRR